MKYRDTKTAKIRASAWHSILGAITFFAVAATANGADAQVVSASARYNYGALMVYGATAKPRQYVQLNRFRIQRSNREGGFSFRVRRLPRSCVVRLRSAGDVRKVPIRNCPLRN